MNNFEMEIWYYLCGFYPELKKKITSPFRKDNNAGCSFGIYNNYVRFYDGADNIRSGKTAVQLYSIQYNLSFEEALAECKEKFSKKKNTEISNTIVNTSKELSNYEIKPIKKRWTKEGKEYWSNIGVTDLSGIFQISGISIVTDTSCKLVDKNNELCFGYLFDMGEYKIYTPFPKEKKDKWIGSVKKFNSWWYNKDSESKEIIFIAKASKDFKVVESIAKENNWNFTMFHLQSERVGKVKSNIPNYTTIKKFKRSVTVLDNDKTGIESSEILKDYFGTECHFTEFGKDITEFYQLKGREEVTNWLRSILFKEIGAL